MRKQRKYNLFIQILLLVVVTNSYAQQEKITIVNQQFEQNKNLENDIIWLKAEQQGCLLYTSPSPRDS